MNLPTGFRLLRTLCLLGAVSFGCTGAAAAADDWPIFLGVDRNARSTEKLSLPWPDAGPKILWTVEFNESYAAPAIAKGGLFLFDRLGDKARLSRLSARDGKLVWRTEYPTSYSDQFDFAGGPRVAPMFEAGSENAKGRGALDRVYAFGVDGKLRCHNAATGEVLWEHDTNEEFGVVQNFFGVASSPVIYGDLLWVSIGGSPKGDWDNHTQRIAPNGVGLVAFDKLTGAVRYKTLNDLASYSSLVIHRLGGKDRLLTFARSGLWVVDPVSGEVLANHPWRSKKNYSVNASTPLVVGDEIFVSESYSKGGILLRWVNAEEGDGGDLEVVWKDHKVLREQSLATHWNTPVFDNGYLYGSHGEKSGPAELRCVEWSTGKVLWKHKGLRRSNLMYADGHLVVLGEYGELVVVEATPEAYREKHKVKFTETRNGQEVPLLKHPSWNAPVLANGVLYVAGADRLVALDLGP